MMMELDSPPTKARVEISRRAVDLVKLLFGKNESSPN